MKNAADLTPAYALRKSLTRQWYEDHAHGTLQRATVRSVTIEPVATSEFYGGPLSIYEADDQTLMANGLVDAADLPQARPGCKTSRRVNKDLIKTYRMPDGRVRLTISTHLVRQGDAGFVDFLARTVGGALIQSAAGAVPKA